jgi:methyl-accepting chemotaxis protein
MQWDYIIFFGLVAAVAVFTVAGTYWFYRRGIAIRLNGLVVAMTAAAAIAGFLFGKQGLNLGTLLICVAILVPAYLLMLLILHRIITPIKEVSETALKIASGDIDQEIKSKGWDELQDLIDAFTQMRTYLKGIADTADKISTGNLAVEVTPASESDRLGIAFKNMIINLRQAISQVTESADHLGHDYGKISEASQQASQSVAAIDAQLQQVAQDTDMQMQNLASTTNSIEQMIRALTEVSKGAQEQAHAVSRAFSITAQITQKINTMSDSAESGAAHATEAVQVAHRGARTIESTVKRMENIRQSTLKVQDKVGLMGERSAKIGTILETTEEIASQTNLLALNAAIEAARVGEHGKGFAVVADEVRKLAEKSALATKEIAQLIRDIQETVSETAQAIAEEAVEVEAGASQSSEAVQALDGIIQTVDSIGKRMNEMSQSSQAISSVTQELSSAVETVSAVVEENTASIEEISASSAEVEMAVQTFQQMSEQNYSAVESVSEMVRGVNGQVSRVVSAIQNMSDKSVTLQQNVLKLATTKITGKVSRGNALIGRIDFVKQKYSQSAWERVLSRLKPADQTVLRGKIDPDGAYPTELLGDLTEAIRMELAGGSNSILREMTRFRAKFDIQPGAPLAQYFRKGDPGYIIRRMDLCLRHNWGEGVVVRIQDLAANHVRMEVDMGKKQPRERCTYNHVGWMEGVIDAAGGVPYIQKTKCMHDGAPFCEYDVRWEMKK